ncbi:MAG TPA: YCF48-related protein [Terriglobales bacterium]
MESLPKIVESQLKKDLRVSVEQHPDAELLAAFSEKMLAESERAIVLMHLSQCSECRDVVFLSAPRQEVQEAQAVPIRKVFSWRPVFAWSGVVACALIVGSVALMKHENQNKDVAVYLKQAAPAMVMQKVISPEPAQPSAAETNQSLTNQSLKKETAKAATIVAMPAKGADKDSSNAMSSSRVSGAALGSAPTTAPQSPSAEVSKSLDVLEPRSSDVLEPRSSANLPQTTEARISIAPAVAAPQAASAQSAPQGGPVSLKESFADTASTKGMITNLKLDDRSPRWTLNSDGTLLRSVDTGTSWKKIMIPGNLATLRTIATVGADVWVGGSEGTVYHSFDAGGHWLPISLTYNGKPLSDDVISIKFVSPQQGSILTDAQAVWTTADGGQTWNKK